MKENILIVDDEPDIRDVISAILNDEGYKTTCVSNAQEAQAKIELLKVQVETLKEIMESIKWRHQTIKNMIEWRKFTSGV